MSDAARHADRPHIAHAAAARPLDPARRRRILEAGMGLFSGLPYAAVHMDAVAAAAGVAKPTLYRYFSTKEALFIAGLAWTLADLREAIGAIRAVDAPARLRAAVALVLERVGALSPALTAIEGRGAEFGERSRRVLREGFDGLRGALADLLRAGVEAGELAVPDVELAVLMILGGIRMAVHGTGRRAPASAAVADFFLHGLGAPAPSTGAPR
ncbi:MULTISPECIES: TetR/AcrR family transcriptional regulator [Methylobacterium]|jgi:AcrR family transcriptional regulator|uniref:TetR/AcrR family transcriptional regulator n=2 Tax=Methylobacteriaceae TaxID=119045 RepID=UPI0008DF71BD|nr:MULTISPECIES: TetR/AcrR family transcriptional regulator [Methylobacterium]MBZ6413324.1 TetR/AcrR family transcriptional regulator [Methylobacterium sp.]SFF45393.1 transcriptional regulator, TetR family [Methylobacterium sp. yr596]